MDIPFFPFSALRSQCVTPTLCSFLCGCCGSSSGPHKCAAGSWLVEPFPQPQSVFELTLRWDISWRYLVFGDHSRHLSFILPENVLAPEAMKSSFHVLHIFNPDVLGIFFMCMCLHEGCLPYFFEIEPLIDLGVHQFTRLADQFWDPPASAPQH